jgi:hypothetical protein
MNAITKPAHWTVGKKAPNGYTVARVREFFAVLKSDDKPAKWATEFINGKVVNAANSAEAGQKGRDFRDAQKEKGVKVERPAAKKAAAKAPAKTAKATPAKPAAKKPTAKDKANGRGAAKAPAKAPAKTVSPARSSRTRKTATARVAK